MEKNCQKCGAEIEPVRNRKLCKKCIRIKINEYRKSIYKSIKKDKPCNKCGKPVGESENSKRGRTRMFCEDCKPKKRDWNCKCEKCGKEWKLIDSHHKEAPNVCRDCIRGKWASKTQKICKICKVKESQNGKYCHPCKSFRSKIRHEWRFITDGDIIGFNEFMNRINNRGGMASKEEIFIELLGWAGKFLNIDWYGGTPQEQISKMWRDLNKVYPTFKIDV
jgi:hypothetical protein